MEQDFYSIVILAILMTPLCFPLQEIIFNIDPLSISDRKLKRFRTRLNRRLNDVNDYSNVFSSTTTELPVGEIIPEFTTDQLSAIRFGDWKMITGEIGYNRIIPNPITEIYRCELLKIILLLIVSVFIGMNIVTNLVSFKRFNTLPLFELN